MPNSVASPRPDGSGCVLFALYLLLVCSNSPEFLCIPAPVAECSRRWHFPEPQLSGQALCFATAIQDYLNIELSICVPREIRTVRDELCRSVLLQDSPQEFSSDPFCQSWTTFCTVSVVQVLLFSPQGSTALQESLLVLSPWLLLC